MMMNNTNQIKQLLDKYFEGETSLEEEKELKMYFNESDIADELKAHQSLFQFFKIEKEVTFPKEKQQKNTTPLYKTSTKAIAQPAKIKRLYVHISRIAAIALVAICAYFLLPKNDVNQTQQAINWEQYEVTDEKEALEKTVAALRLVSSKLNGGAKRAAKEVHHIQAAAKIFKK